MIIIVIILYIIGIPILDLIELRTFDRRFHWRGIKKPSPIVVAAVIDEKSLDQEGKWPWPRHKIAELINKLSDDGAKVIGFDVFFSEPDENSNLILINQLNQKIESLQIENDKLKEFLNETKLKADNDLILANSIRESKADIILGYFFHTEMESLGQEISDKELENRVKNISNSIYPLILYEGGEMVTDPFAYAEITP